VLISHKHALEAEMEAIKAAHVQHLEELRREVNDPYFRDTMLAPTHPNAQLMQRAEDSSFRKVERLTALLMKLKGKGEAAYPAHNENEGISHDVIENKGGQGDIPRCA